LVFFFDFIPLLFWTKAASIPLRATTDAYFFPCGRPDVLRGELGRTAFSSYFFFVYVFTVASILSPGGAAGSEAYFSSRFLAFDELLVGSFPVLTPLGAFGDAPLPFFRLL